MDGKRLEKMRRVVRNNRVLTSANDARVAVRDRRRRRDANRYGAEVARRVVEALESVGFEPVLIAGTLLGAVRNGRILPHDDDLDIAIILDNESWAKIDAALADAGFPIARRFSLDGNIREQAYYAKGFTFDIFGLHHTHESGALRIYYFCRLKGREYEHFDDRSVMYMDIPEFTSRKSACLWDAKLPIPGNAEEILEAHYGVGWRVPDPSWKSGTGFTLLEDRIVRRETFPIGFKRNSRW